MAAIHTRERVRLVTPAQVDRLFELTDTFGFLRDQVIIPLVGDTEGLIKLMPDGKLLIHAPVGPKFDPWFAGLAERLSGMDLSRVPRVVRND